LIRAFDPPTVYAELDKERAGRIADEFDKMKHEPDNPEVKGSGKGIPMPKSSEPSEPLGYAPWLSDPDQPASMTDEEIAAAARKAKEFMMQVTTPKKPETPKEKPEDEERWIGQRTRRIRALCGQ
jgi:hypothetical protein